MADEVWRAVIGLEGRYEVSDLGRVRSLDREVITSHGVTRRYRGRPLTPSVGNHGYLVVSVGRRVKRTVHSLVAEAFIGPRPNGQEVRHKDGNALDCRAANLEYGTSRDNTADAIRHGTHVPPPDHNSSKERDPLGHLLRHPNLRKAQLKQGKRGCRACHQAAGIRQWAEARGETIDFRKVADQKYQLIMGSVTELETATRE